MKTHRTTIDPSALTTEELLKKARLKAMQLLQIRDRSEQEIRSKLEEKEFPQDVIDQTVEFLYSHHYLDDVRAASNYIRTKLGSYSNFEIRAKLIQKGFSREVIDKAFEDTASEEEGLPCEADAARRMVAVKLKGRDRITYEEKQKFVASLYRKGYSREAVNLAFEGVEIVRTLTDDFD